MKVAPPKVDVSTSLLKVHNNFVRLSPRVRVLDVYDFFLFRVLGFMIKVLGVLRQSLIIICDKNKTQK